MNKHILQHVKAPVALAFMLAATVLTSACSSNDKDKIKDAVEEAEGTALFGLHCASCHTGNGMGDGTTGGDISDATVDEITAALNGGVAAMSAVENLSTDEITAIVNALDSGSTSEADYANADGIKGGQLYSKFWVNHEGESVTSEKLTAEQVADINAAADFFRCKQCHGWDRLGREGGYSDRAPKTTRPNVSGIDLASLSASVSAEDLFGRIKRDNQSRRDLTADLSTYDPETNSALGDMMPNYSQILTDEQIWDIVKYLKAEAFDTTELYDITFPEGGEYPTRPREFSDIGKNGQASNGDIVYADNCASCHGADGTGGAVGLVDGDEYTVGAHVRKKPYEDQHKVKFGHLGTKNGLFMHPILTDIEDVKDLLVALTDTVKYPDEAPVVVALDGTALFAASCGGCHTGNGMGTGSFGDVTNASATFISEKIASVQLMASFSSLSDAEIEAIAGALADL